MFGKSNLVKCVISFVSVCCLSPSGSPDRGTRLPALGSLCLWLTLRRKTHSRGPSPWLRCKTGSGGFRSLHGCSSNAKATQELPLASGGWAPAALPPLARVQLSFQTNREALPALQLACCQAGPSYPDHLPAGRLPASGWALPGSALGMVPFFLPRS